MQECLTDACLLGLENLTVDASKTVAEAMRQIPPGNVIESELKNKFAFLVDVDGAGYSTDLESFLQFNTPILRQVGMLHSCRHFNCCWMDDCLGCDLLLHQGS